MKYVLFYTSAENVAAKAGPVFPAHKAHYEKFQARGVLLLLGTFEDPQADGSMAVFTTREAAEEFAAADPFVRSGVVASYQIKGWNEVLS
jgi:uncharacterized protein YciI